MIFLFNFDISRLHLDELAFYIDKDLSNDIFRLHLNEYNLTMRTYMNY